MIQQSAICVGDYSISDLADLFSVLRPTAYRTIRRMGIGV